MRILLWHVHGGWMNSFVLGHHEYLLPTTPDGGAWGLGRGGRDWPAAAVEVPPQELASTDFDVVVLQRPEEIEACERLTGRRPGRDVPAIYLEHNTPKGTVPQTVHPMADQSSIPLVHVTHFNRLFWDNGRAPVKVIEHGVPDPGLLYTGTDEVQGVVINEPVRRGRVTGTDLLPRFSQAGPLRLFGLGTDDVSTALGLGPPRTQIRGDVPASSMHRELAACRLYLHPLRWTSLGLALLEAMHLGMPVVVLDATEASRAVPPEAGAISTDVDELVRAATTLLRDPAEARRRGLVAREAALAHYNLERFLSDWDDVLDATASVRPSRTKGARS